ncbi:ROK family protein [Catenulispora sp. GP43]|uniref:ROK family protein n=1 Tax=Catenulispora sp. GP43 TaxID=3156263 RepID=UPI00351919EF
MERRQAGTNLTGLRDHNTALVLGLLRAAGDGADTDTDTDADTDADAGAVAGGSSRVQLAAQTGLTPQAISKITARLLAEGLIEEAGRSASTGGKPRTLLALRPEAGCAVGVELDRRRGTILLVDLAGRTLGARTLPFGLASGKPERVAVELGERVRGLIGSASAGARVLGVGIGCRGPLDHETGVLHRPAGLPAWDGYPLRDEVDAYLDVPTVLLDKDTNTAALAAPAPGNTAYLHFADGLGAGMLLNGALYRGARTNAGEFGHQVVQPDGPVCTCGARGCLEALCLAALAEGDPQTAARWLGLGAANLVRLLDIDRILLGGHQIFAAPDLYLRAVVDQIAAHLPDPAWQNVQVSLTPAGEDAVAVGAAQLVLDTMFVTPATRISPLSSR